jgi:nitrogen fixation NifU-like protein
MTDFTHSAKGFNYFCGDIFNIYLKIIDNKIENISFDGKGCSISTASASLMTISIKNKKINEFIETFDYLKKLLNNKNIENNSEYISILSNVKNFPSRVKCATLIWHTTEDAIQNGKIK